MNGIGIDRWPGGMKERETDRDRCKERQRETKRGEDGGWREGADVVGGWRECFLKVCQWVLDEMLKENDCCVTRSART